jgi:hypothetical protein
MARPDDHEPGSKSNAGWIVVGFVAVIALLVIGFFAVDAIIGRQ